MARMLTIRTALVLTACLALASCGTTYVAQAAKGQLQILTARKPITKILADPAADARLKQRLGVVREAREFAWRELGLPNNKSYTAYADLKRDFVVWSVVATPEFSVAPREWCFPIVGCVAYRGYFRKDSAEAFAETLRSEGLDTIVGGVPAYSTLGKFNDPILNTMMVYGDDELASIMFHELSHQLVYIQDDTSFNEAFAVTVEQEGLARWLKFRGREPDLANYQKRRTRQAEGVALVAQFRGELSALYGMQIEPEVMRARKAQVFARLVAELRALDERFGTESRLAAELDGKPNNARLASLATYYDCVPGFERLLAGEQHDLPRFYEAARALAKLPREERRSRLCAAETANAGF
jgi:predicted aminopeptidase